MTGVQTCALPISVLAFELAAFVQEGRPFSLDAYVKALKTLPDLPLEE